MIRYSLTAQQLNLQASVAMKHHKRSLILSFILLIGLSLLGLRLIGEHAFAVNPENHLATPPSTQTELYKNTQTLLSNDTQKRATYFYPLGDPHQALISRIVLTEMATLSLDVQYYLFHDDDTGRALLSAILEAAKRGVKVRLLLDDMDTKGRDGLFIKLRGKPRRSAGPAFRAGMNSVRGEASLSCQFGARCCSMVCLIAEIWTRRNGWQTTKAAAGHYPTVSIQRQHIPSSNPAAGKVDRMYSKFDTVYNNSYSGKITHPSLGCSRFTSTIGPCNVFKPSNSSCVPMLSKPASCISLRGAVDTSTTRPWHCSRRITKQEALISAM